MNFAGDKIVQRIGQKRKTSMKLTIYELDKIVHQLDKLDNFVQLKYVMSFLTWARYHARLQDTCQNVKCFDMFIAKCFT